MKILTIRTDRPEAEIGLFSDTNELGYCKWQAHRQLAKTIHSKIDGLLKESSLKLEDLNAIVVYKGPGSFTGLRIGLSVANALAYSLNIPIAATSGDDWIETGIAMLAEGKGGKTAVPEYGREPHITQQKK